MTRKKERHDTERDLPGPTEHLQFNKIPTEGADVNRINTKNTLPVKNQQRGAAINRR